MKNCYRYEINIENEIRHDRRTASRVSIVVKDSFTDAMINRRISNLRQNRRAECFYGVVFSNVIVTPTVNVSCRQTV